MLLVAEFTATTSDPPFRARQGKPGRGALADHRALKQGFRLDAYVIVSEVRSGRRLRIDVWREDYNHRRPHTSLGNLTPAEFADQLRKARELP